MKRKTLSSEIPLNQKGETGQFLHSDRYFQELICMGGIIRPSKQLDRKVGHSQGTEKAGREYESCLWPRKSGMSKCLNLTGSCLFLKVLDLWLKGDIQADCP